MKYDNYWFRKNIDGELEVNASTNGCGCCAEYYNPEYDHDSDYKTAPTIAELEAYAIKLKKDAESFESRLKLYKLQTG